MSDVKYVSREGLVEKSKVTYEVKFAGVTAFIRETLNKIPVGKAVTLLAVRQVVLAQYPAMTKDGAYDRIKFTMDGKGCQGFKKMEDKDGITYIARQS